MSAETFDRELFHNEKLKNMSAKTFYRELFHNGVSMEDANKKLKNMFEKSTMDQMICFDNKESKHITYTKDEKEYIIYCNSIWSLSYRKKLEKMNNDRNTINSSDTLKRMFSI